MSRCHGPGLAVALVTLLAPRPAVGAETSAPELPVRRSVCAGSWYPADPDILRRMLAHMEKAYLEKPAPVRELAGHVAGLMLPHAGMVYSGRCAVAASRVLAGRPYQRVIVMGLSHRAPLRGISGGLFQAYETPLGRIPVDLPAVQKLSTHPLFAAPSDLHVQEHSLEMLLPYLQFYIRGPWKLVPLLVGELTADQFAQAAEALRPLLDDQTLLAASTDFMHHGWRYGDQRFKDNRRPQLYDLDHQAFSAIVGGDRPLFIDLCEKKRLSICGRMPVGLLVELLAGQAAPVEMDYYTSADVVLPADGVAVQYRPGSEEDYETSVSYLSAVFVRPPQLDEADRRLLLRLCRQRLETIVRQPDQADQVHVPAEASAALRTLAGSFVTLRLKGKLRGCIGTVVPHRPLVEDALRHVADSALRDPRFRPVTADEVKDIRLEISVLSPLRRETEMEKIQVGKHGLVIQHEQGSGLLLPQVATEQGWSLLEFLQATCRKAGLPPYAFRQGGRVYVFTAQVFGEPSGDDKP